MVFTVTVHKYVNGSRIANYRTVSAKTEAEAIEKAIARMEGWSFTRCIFGS